MFPKWMLELQEGILKKQTLHVNTLTTIIKLTQFLMIDTRSTSAAK